MRKALLVIDMQEATVGKNHADFFKYDTALLKKVNNVINNTDADLVVYIRNLMKNNFINKFAPVKVFDGTSDSELVKDLQVVSSNIFSKYSGDAFTNENFSDFMKTNHIDTIEIIGLDGGGCVSLTAFGALKNGYRVILNTSAIGTMFGTKKEKYYEKLKKLGAEFL